MTIRKITIDNTVRYIPKNEQTRQNKLNTIKKNSVPRNYKKNVSQYNKKLLKNLAGERFGILKRIMNCYF